MKHKLRKKRSKIKVHLTSWGSCYLGWQMWSNAREKSDFS